MNKFIFPALILTLFVFKVQAGDVPADWYKETDGPAALQFTKPSAKSERTLTNVARAHLQAMQDLPKINSPLQLAAFSLDFGVTMSGLVGFLGFNGSPAFTAFWHKKGSAAITEHISELEYMVQSHSKLAAEADLLFRLVINSGQVPGSDELRSALQDLLLNFAKLAEQVGAINHPRWLAKKLSVTRYVAITGQISHGANAGGGVRVTLNYPMARAAEKSQGDSGNLVYQLADVLTEAQQEARARWPLKSVSVGLGLTSSLGLGIVHVDADEIGSIELVPKSETADFRAKSDGNIPMISGSVDKIITHLDKKRLKAGMIKAMQMSDWFAATLGAYQTEEWLLSGIKSEFNMGTNGSLLLALIRAKGTFSMTHGL